MSPRRPSNSSSASRNTLLSSTMTIRIRSSPGTVAESMGELLGRDEQRVVRLAAFVRFELDPWMLRLQRAHELSEIRRIDTAEKRDDVARLGQQALEHRTRDVLEGGALGDRFLSREPEEVALSDHEPVETRVLRRDGDGAGRDRRERFVHGEFVRVRVLRRVEGEGRSETGGQPNAPPPPPPPP